MQSTTTLDLPSVPQSWLERPLIGKLSPATLILILICALSLGLHLINLQAVGDGNIYYTAAVKSMLQSWHNFFYVAAEPGGSVSVDKPPLGLWIETVFAAVFGVSGVSVVMPNILAGVASVAVLYILVKRYWGALPGLVAALVLALTPVSLAVDRNNTVDGMLVLTLLLAAWAFLSATESGKLRALLLGGVVVGLGFNIKMMEVLLPAPAFMLLYLLGAKVRWGRKVLSLLLTGLVIAVVSLSWALVVDLTPVDQHPYVGSSDSNTELGLVFGHNGIERLLGRGSTGTSNTASMITTGAANEAGATTRPAQPSGGSRTAADTPSGAGRDDAASSRGGSPTGGETGNVGVLRFFERPLAKEMSWLLPFGLLALLGLVVSARPRLPLDSPAHKGAVLFGGWLLTCVVFFSMASYFHAYYLTVAAPALAALVGAGVALFHKLSQRNRLAAFLALTAAAVLTLAFQWRLASAYNLSSNWLIVCLVLLGLGVGGLAAALVLKRRGRFLYNLASAVVLAALLLIPAEWSWLTVGNPAPSSKLPEAWAGSSGQGGMSSSGSIVDESVVEYLEANTIDTTYLAAVSSAQAGGASLVLQTGRPVLYVGGYSGSDDVIDEQGLADLAAAGELRYVLVSGSGRSGTLASFASDYCQPASDLNSKSGTLYVCSAPAGR
ncbi:MAG: glycosyltransferase family 39 protein [Chloroflexi bacterium]|nr:glycosyltransferase family 39 protein [Chloroflexota bacterium]